MNKHRASVSLCMIVRNEAQQLADCLTPVADLFDQIVIVDTGSRDATPTIARRFTPHVVDFAWCDDFSAARNESLRHATGDWIFWLDADDRLSADNVRRLRRLLDQLNDQPRAFMMDTVCVGRDSIETRLITHPRLFRRHAELRWQGRVHEQLRPCPSTLGYDLCFSDVQIEHLGYRDAALRQRKLQRDVRLLRMDYAVDPDEPSTLLHLGQAYAQLGNALEARKHFARLLSGERRSVEYLRRVFATLAELSLAEGKHAEVVAIIDRALAAFPHDEHLLYLKAEALYELDDFAAAQQALLTIIAGPPTLHYHAGAPGQIKTRLAPRSLGEVFRIQGHHQAAEGVLRGVVEAFPCDAIAWHALGRVYIDLGQRQNLDEVCRRLSDFPGGGECEKLLLAAWHLKTGEFALAEPLLDELIGQSPYLPMARLMRAECLKRRGAPSAARLQALRDVLRVEPGNSQAAAMVERLEAAAHQPSVPNQPSVPGPEAWCTSVMLGAGISTGTATA